MKATIRLSVQLTVAIAAVQIAAAQKIAATTKAGHSCISHVQIPMRQSVANANGWQCINCNGQALIESQATPDKTWGPPYVLQRICKVYVSPESNAWYGDGQRCSFSYVKRSADPC